MNVTKKQALREATDAMRKTGRDTCIWFMGRRDGWRWDYLEYIDWSYVDTKIHRFQLVKPPGWQP